MWTWTALCADTKLMVSWLVADRSAGAEFEFGPSAGQIVTDARHPWQHKPEAATRGTEHPTTPAEPPQALPRLA